MPDDLCFATKPQLAVVMLAHSRRLGIQARWVAGDEVYGGRGIRARSRELGFDYALAVRADHTVSTPAGRFTSTALATRLPRRAWMRMRTGHGLKGDRHYDWAIIDVQPDDTPDTGDAPGDVHSFLVVRRHRYTRELSFYRCHSAVPVALADLVHAICTRWKIEKTFQNAKSITGLDQGQVTRGNSWMHWSLISLLAAAVLAVTRVRTTRATSESELPPGSPRTAQHAEDHRASPSPTGERTTSYAGPPDAAAIKPPPRPATAAGTTSPPQPPDLHKHIKDQELQLR
ncbi:transposase [Streptomyces sp. NWU339]|uniref:transposase n=1 Tax=Streptomyces sp. NWU339 TaxID=2185284 RepID=UPI0015E801E8|nr:transposase [Streptomyces sp. NWU339]